MPLLRKIASALVELLRDVLPIILVIVFFQLAVLGQPFPHLSEVVWGMVLVVIGLFLFTQGLERGLFPLGESLAYDFARKGSLLWLLVFAFTIGYATTVAEPALLAVAEKAQEISAGRLDQFMVRSVVAASVGFAIALGVLRILLGHPIHYYIIGGYLLIVAVTSIAPREVIGLAYDSGGVTTSTVTVPLVAALGVGLASSVEGRNPLVDGFGLIAFASLTPILAVMLYGIWVY
ncbi:MAG: DUF1538 domain-containing protein [Nitrospirota bacterium]|nr:DUF1538 domain-containing protein [Nitrospirota bacterium]